MSDFGLFSSPHWHMAAIEGEALLGLWLLTGALPRLLWLAALVGFAGLAGISLYLGVEGQPSCGCFGSKLIISPWYALALDLAAVTSLLWWRPLREYQAAAPYSAPCRRILLAGAGAGAILALVVGGLIGMHGSPGKALLHLRGETITVEPSMSQVGDGIVGEDRTFTIRLSNPGDRPIRILGGTTTCSCISTDDLPITVPPTESQSISVRIRFWGAPGRFQHSFVLYLDDEGRSIVTARFVGRVIASPSP